MAWKYNSNSQHLSKVGTPAMRGTLIKYGILQEQGHLQQRDTGNSRTPKVCNIRTPKGCSSRNRPSYLLLSQLFPWRDQP